MQSYSTFIGVIEFRLQKVGYMTTQKRYGIGSGTVTLIMKRFHELSILPAELRAMEPKAVEIAFYPPENLQRSEKPTPDSYKIHERMTAMAHPDLSLIWEDYKKENPSGYQLSQFYKLCWDFLQENFGQ